MKSKCTCLLIIVCMWANTVSGECVGSAKNQKIIKHVANPFYVDEGNDAVINWTFCKDNTSAITGFIVYQYSSSNSRNSTALLSMSTQGSVYDNRRHKLWDRVCVMQNEDHITFVIKNVSMTDSNYYSLCIRREGLPDLKSEVQIVVVPIHEIDEQMAGPMTKEKTNQFPTEENAEPTRGQKKRRMPVIALTCSVSAIFVVIVILSILYTCYKLRKGKDPVSQDNQRLVKNGSELPQFMQPETDLSG